MQLTFEYPVWYLGLCALAGLLVAGLLYYRSSLEASKPLLLLLATFRFLAFTLLAALLLTPLLRFVSTDREEPLIVVVQDVSESVGLATDTTSYSPAWTALRDQLAEEYEVIDYTLGSQVRRGGGLTYVDKQTDLDAALTEIADLYGNRNLGAVVLASDGIYNAGRNPAYREYPLRAPVYTVGLGDTTRRRDLLVSRVFNNRIAYLDDRFTIQVDVAARNASAAATTLTVSRVGEGGSTVLHTESIAIDAPDFFTTREITLDADRAGVQRYRIALTGITDEVSTANNQRDIYIDVLDARQKILVLAAAPHPDLSALRQALVGAKNNEVEVAYGDRFVGTVKDYDLLILHRLPSATNRVASILDIARAESIPTLFITGAGLPSPLINGAQDVVRTEGGGAQVQGNEVTAVLVPGFTAFTLSEELRRALPTFPPLTAPYGNFTAGPGASVLLSQRIGRVETPFPLLAVGQSRGVRTGILLADGLWQWRLFDYLEGGDHARFDELVSQLVQYLTVENDKRRFRVSVAENVFDENEPVRLDGELYNGSYELVNTPEATVTVSNAEGREYAYTFTRTADAYTLDAGTLPPGAYRFRAAVSEGGEALVSEGRFTIQALELERYALEADHGLMRELSTRYGGDFVLPDELAGLADRIIGSGGAKPLLFETINTKSLVNLKWVFFLLFILLVGEWGLRRWSGGY